MTTMTILKGRLSGSQRQHLKRLLDMNYTPAEIAREIGFGRRQFYRVYVPMGCPHERQPNGRIWVNGHEFSDWYQQTYLVSKLNPGETFCLTCKQPVAIVNPIQKQKDGLQYIQSKCPVCGRVLSRFIKNRRLHDDPAGQ